MATIDMQTMRYLNLLSKVSGVQTRYCFIYNNMVIFAVPRDLISRAIGNEAKNIRVMQETLGKRVKIVAEPRNEADAEQLIRTVVDPIKFKSVEEKDGELVLTAGNGNKASLIGRNKRRLEELQVITENCFGKKVKIV